jgi:hypothetical protein
MQFVLVKLIVPQLVSKLPTFYGIRRFITAFTTARHVSLSWARSIQSMPQSHFSKVHFNIILSSTLGFSKWSPSFRFFHQNRICTFSLPYACRAHLILLDVVTGVTSDHLTYLRIPGTYASTRHQKLEKSSAIVGVVSVKEHQQLWMDTKQSRGASNRAASAGLSFGVPQLVTF